VVDYLSVWRVVSVLEDQELDADRLFVDPFDGGSDDMLIVCEVNLFPELAFFVGVG